MRNIEQVAAYVPYMVSIGNHEDAPLNLAYGVLPLACIYNLKDH